MAPSHLAGLNIVHPPVEQPEGLTDTQDLLSAPPYADLSAQLDFWTSLNFHDEPTSTPASSEDERKFRTRELLKERERSEDTEGKNQDAPHQQQPTPTQQQPAQPPFDINSFLIGIGIDPFHLPPAQSSLMTNLPTLAQILAAQQQLALAGPPHLVSATAPAPVTSSSSTAGAAAPPPSKRARTRKSSVSTVDSPEDTTIALPSTPVADTPGRPLSPSSAAEDKRRRNTAASARFRLKKKEREAALEQRAKELENKVNELERECEGLRRENGWLKGLVVGVTGVGAAPSLPPSLGGPIAGSKRTRDGGGRA